MVVVMHTGASEEQIQHVVDRLVARGWIRRWHDDADRRVVLLELTAEGTRAAYERAAG